MNRSLAALCLFLMIVPAVAAAAPDSPVRRVPVREDGGTSLRVVGREAAATTMRAEIGELRIERVATPEGEFSRVVIPGFHSGREVGTPQLPRMNRLIAMPHGATARVEVRAGRVRTVDLDAIGAAPRLLPVQPSVSKSADPDTVGFVIDERSYAVDEVRPPAAVFERLGRLRSLDIGRLEISPVSYLPRERKLLVNEDIEVRVVFEGGDPAAGEDLAAAAASPYFEPVYARVAGGPLHDSNPDLTAEKVTMVVVAPDSMTAALEPLLRWKREKGFRTVLGVLGDPEVGNSTYTIREYIAGLYRDGTAAQPAPSFVLLVGDVDILPTHTVNGDATDRPYCEMDGDLFPDIYYGRFSVETVAQLEAVVAKTLAYEQLTVPDTSYLGRAVLIAGVDAAYSTVFANGQINYASQTYFNPEHQIDAEVFLYPESGAAAEEIRDLAGAGAGFINYTAHGSEIRWSNPRFSVDQVDSLQNSGRYGLVVGNCCLTAKYDHETTCFGEAWLRRPDGGAIGYIGGSNSTYWNEDYWWSVGYTAEITGSPIYEGTSQGALDGLFHEGGEGAYVTSDAMIFCGNLAVSEAAGDGGTGREEYYWNIYNLLGDPSVTPYLREPDANQVSAPERLSVTATSVTVAAEPGSYVGLSQDGELLAGGAVGAGGEAVLDIASPPAEGFARLVVTAQNRRPWIADLPVAVPALVTVEPDTVPVGVESTVSLTVVDADSGDPLPGIEIRAEGWWYASETVVTDASGSASLTVDYPYGPSLDLIGQDPTQPFQAFRDTLAVAAAPLTSPRLVAGSDVGVLGSFPLNLEGFLGGGAVEEGVEIWLFPPEGDPIGTTESMLTWTAGVLGDATGLLVKPGYDVYEQVFPVIKVFGTLSGYVFAGEQVAAGVPVRGYADGVLVFETETASNGYYQVYGEILAAEYTIEVELFGWRDYSSEFFVLYGSNTLNIDLQPAEKTSLSGLVLDGSDAGPVDAGIELRRRDNNELYDSGNTDPADGSFILHQLPEGAYDLLVTADGYMPARQEVDLLAGGDPLLLLLDPVGGEILIVDATAKSRAKTAAARGIPPKGPLPDAESAEDMTADEISASLRLRGYGATVEAAAETDTAGWGGYDLVLLACGANSEPLDTLPELRAALVRRAAEGGRILVEGGEVGYYWTRIDQVDSLFVRDVLHVTQWVQDESGAVVVVEPRHLTAAAPHPLPSPISVGYSGYVDQDMMLPSRDVVVVGSWSRNSSGASIITFDPTPETEGGRLVYFTFSYLAADPLVREDMLQNAVNWLLIPEPGSCSVSGRITLDDGSPAAGAVVRLVPDGGLTVTGDDGGYGLQGVRPGSYSVQVSLLNWLGDPLDLVLDDGEAAVGVDIQLIPDVPRALALHPSYPNPFNAAATMAFDLPETGRVKLAVYDARGRLMLVLREQELPHGYYFESWDGLDSAGRPAPSGIYFARLSAPGGVLVRKMTLVR